MKSLSEVIIYRDLTNKVGESTLDCHSLIYLIFFVKHNTNLLKKMNFIKKGKHFIGYKMQVRISSPLTQHTC